jgi:hypothetical protein
MSETNTSPKPTGGWQQYKLAICVLLLYPLLILGGALMLLPFLGHSHQGRSSKYVVPITSHEPFHLSVTVLPPLRPAPNHD